MASGKWILMSLSWGMILGLAIVCFIKIFRKKES